MALRVNGFWMVLGLLWLAGCAPAYTKYISGYPALTGDGPDYSNLSYWAAHPGKHDPSDSVPLPLRAAYKADSSADVFFLYPTTFTNQQDTGWNAGINDAGINAKTDYSPMLYQASVFNEYRLFAPRYRQANLRAYYSTDTARALQAFELAYQDIKTAFQYYLDHNNNGRPIIIASHSQGSTHAQRLLKEFFENKALSSQLVVAYVIGMRIPKNYFTDLRPCSDSTQTGCFVGWRTFKISYEPAFVIKEAGDSYVTNPLTWTTDETYASKQLNTGAVLINFNKMVPQVCDAQIHGGVLWVHKPHFSGSILLRSKNYHVGDINLFYNNIRQNLRTRVAAFNKRG